MTTCCFCLSLRTGCLVGAAIFFLIAVIKIILLCVLPLPEGPQTIIVMNIVLLVLAGILLLVGTLQQDRVCILTFLCFNICAMVIQAIGLLVQYTALQDEKIAVWILVMLVVEHVPFIYMIPIGIFEYREVKEHHLRVVENYSTPSNRIPVVHTANIPGLGF